MKNDKVRVLEDYHHDLEVANGRKTQLLRADSEEYSAACKELELGMWIARCLLDDTKLSRYIWNEATSTTAAYLYNCMSHKTIGMETSYRIIYGKLLPVAPHT